MASSTKNNLLILTGPQGSGNHMWSKIFSTYDHAHGWKMKDYWEGHHKEPFSHWWDNPKKIHDTGHEYNFTSISCPYYRDREPQIPKYKEFIFRADKIYNVKIAVIGRDNTILKEQQERVRGEHTFPTAEKELQYIFDWIGLMNVHFLSTELFFLYGKNYLHYISDILKFPIDVTKVQSMSDTNTKYIRTGLQEQPLDKDVKRVSLRES